MTTQAGTSSRMRLGFGGGTARIHTVFRTGNIRAATISAAI